MRVAVVGAGIIGTLSAHFLNEHGLQVTVFDQASEAASMTSKANGGQLSYSFCDALADPQLLPKLPKILLGRDPAFSIRFGTDFDFWRWSLKFLAECTPSKRDKNTLSLLSMTLRSAELMQPLHQRFGHIYHHADPGKLVLLSQPPSKELRRRTALKADHGVNVCLMSTDQLLQREPLLNRWNWRPAGALFSQHDEVGDAQRFTTALAAELESIGVTFRFNTQVNQLTPVKSGGCLIKTNGGEDHYDAIVVATGHQAKRLLSPHVRTTPMLSMAGYSVTLPATHESPNTSITLLDDRIVFSRLGDQIRVAGFADVNARPNGLESRTDQLMRVAESVAPSIADFSASPRHNWQGTRAMTPNSQPLVGRTNQPSLFTNIGHGMLGWTLGAATAELLCKQVLQQLS